MKETLSKSTFYREPAKLCNAEIAKIKNLAPLRLPQQFLGFSIRATLTMTFFMLTRWTVSAALALITRLPTAGV